MVGSPYHKGRTQMRVIEKIKERARKNPQRIVLAEGKEQRTIEAAVICHKDRIAFPVILGNEEWIRDSALSLRINLDGIEIVDPDVFPNVGKYISMYIESRRDRQITQKMAERLLKRPPYFGAMMVRAGDVNGMVAGALSLTATVIKAGELIIGLKEGISSPSSLFVMSRMNP